VRAVTKGVLVAVVFVNVALILAGLLLAPATLGSLAGVGIVVADIGLQGTLLAVGLTGPVSLDRLGDAAGYCLAAAVAFALAYDALLLLDLAGRPVQLSPYVPFVIAAVVASCVAGYRTRRLLQGLLAAVWSLVLGTALWSTGFMTMTYVLWGTRREYLFWLRDGAVAEFHHGGGRDLSVFLLKDIQGALFFHPFLSLGLGLLLGAAGAGAGLVAATLVGARDRSVVAD